MNLRIFSSLLFFSFALLNCSSEKREIDSFQKNTAPFSLKIYYSQLDSSVFSESAYPDSLFTLFYDSKNHRTQNQFPLLNAEWIRIRWEGAVSSTRDSILYSVLQFPMTYKSKIEAFCNDKSISFDSYIKADSSLDIYSFRLGAFIKDHPTVQFLAVKNPTPRKPNTDEKVDQIRHVTQQFEQKLEPEQLSLVNTVKMFDSSLVKNDINKIRKMILPDYFEDGVLRDDKIRFYTYIAAKMDSMRFEYGNFTFFDLSDGRVRLVYDYRMFKGDSIWDLGFEDRYFRKVGNEWKETGNKQRFYIAPLSTQYLKYDAEFLVYLPPQYFKFPRKTFPVIYVFNDFRDLTKDWMAYNFETYMDKLINEGKISPSIVIFMDGGPSLYFKSAKEKSYDFESFFMKEVGPHFDSVLRITSDRDRRYLTGIGQGGLAAMYYQLKYPTVFYSVATVNGVFKNGLTAKHMDQGNPDYWTDKYPQYYINLMPDYILKNLHFKLIQNPEKPSVEGYKEVVTLLKTRNSNLETAEFKDTWQSNFEWILLEAFGWHTKNYKVSRSKK